MESTFDSKWHNKRLYNSAREKRLRSKEGSVAMEKFLSQTLCCESFHSVKEMKAPKDKFWKTSWLLRMYMAILDFNFKEDIFDMLDKEFGLEIPSVCLKELNDEAEYCQFQKEKKEKEEEKKKK